MRYSLLDQFQGALWGATLGEELGAYSSAQRFQAERAAEKVLLPKQVLLHRWVPGSFCQDIGVAPASGWSNLVLCSQKLIESSGQAELSEKLEQLLTTGQAISVSNDIGLSAGNLVPKPNCTIAALPIALFFHDDEIKLGQILQSVFKDQDEALSSLAFSYAMAQLLKQQLILDDLIPQTIAYLQSSADSAKTSFLFAQLEQVQALLRQEHDSPQTLNQLEEQQFASEQSPRPEVQSNEIALAFYCFLSTPTDFKLTVLRAAHSSKLPQNTCALTAALAGAYNSQAGIPLAWRMAPQLPAWELSATKSQLAAQLLAKWSGVWEATFSGNLPAIAAPGIIRPR